MVTSDQLREHIGRKPFVPFRLDLKNGESVDVVRSQQTAAMNRRIFVGGEVNESSVDLARADRPRRSREAQADMSGELMIIREQLWKLHRADPFEPFRIKFVSGDAHDIADPRTLVILRDVAWIFSPEQHRSVFPIIRINSFESLISDFRGELAHQPRP